MGEYGVHCRARCRRPRYRVSVAAPHEGAQKTIRQCSDRRVLVASLARAENGRAHDGTTSQVCLRSDDRRVHTAGIAGGEGHSGRAGGLCRVEIFPPDWKI